MIRPSASCAARTRTDVSGRQLRSAAIAEDYAEANAWHSLWMTGRTMPTVSPSDGGRQAAIDKLEMFFELAKDDRDNATSPRRTSRPVLLHGNEPDINAPFVFASSVGPT